MYLVGLSLWGRNVTRLHMQLYWGVSINSRKVKKTVMFYCESTLKWWIFSMEFGPTAGPASFCVCSLMSVKTVLLRSKWIKMKYKDLDDLEVNCTRSVLDRRCLNPLDGCHQVCCSTFPEGGQGLSYFINNNKMNLSGRGALFWKNPTHQILPKFSIMLIKSGKI